MGNFRNENESNFRNILILSLGFLLIIGAWRTTAAIQQTILKSVQAEDPSFNGDGYLSQAIINGVFSLTNFIAPAIMTFVGVRTTLVLGTSLYAVFIASFLYPNSWLLYGCSVAIGFGSANVWVAYGTYVTRSSTKESIGKYLGISWAIVSLGPLLGNAFVFWKFQGLNHIDHETRLMVSSILTGVAIMGSITLVFLEKRRRVHHDIEEVNQGAKETIGSSTNYSNSILSAFIRPFRLLVNKHFLLLIPAAMYNGLEMGFSMAIYPTTVAFSEAFGGDTRKLAGIAGILTGAGSLTGGLLFGVFLSKFFKSKRTFMVKSACLAHFTAYLLMYFNLPNAASLGPTMDTSWINPPSIVIAIFCAFLQGLGDACISTQMSAAIGVIWPEDPSPALAMYRFFQAATCALGFYMGTITGLHTLLLIIVTAALIGSLTFHINEAIIAKMEDNCDDDVVITEEVGVVSKRKLSEGFAAMMKNDNSNRSLH